MRVFYPKIIDNMVVVRVRERVDRGRKRGRIKGSEGEIISDVDLDYSGRVFLRSSYVCRCTSSCVSRTLGSRTEGLEKWSSVDGWKVPSPVPGRKEGPL